MTLQFQHTGEGATDEADIVAGATGFGDPWDFVIKTGSPTVKYDTAHSMHGTVSMRIVRPSSSDSAYLRADLGATVARMQVRVYVWIDALPTSVDDLIVFRSTGFMGYLGITAAGKLQLYNTSNTGIAASVASATFPLGQWVRVEAAIAKGTGASDGIIEYAYYLGDSGTVISQWSQAATSGTVGAWAGANTGTLDPFSIRLGHNGTTNVPDTVWYDDPALGDGATGWLGPTTVAAPDAVVTSTLARVIDARGSTVASGTLSYGIVQNPASPAVTPTLLTTGLWQVIPHATSTLTYEITVTGSLGGTDMATATVPPVSSGSAAVVRLVKTGGVFV